MHGWILSWLQNVIPCGEHYCIQSVEEQGVGKCHDNNKWFYALQIQN